MRSVADFLHLNYTIGAGTTRASEVYDHFAQYARDNQLPVIKPTGFGSAVHVVIGAEAARRGLPLRTFIWKSNGVMVYGVRRNNAVGENKMNDVEIAKRLLDSGAVTDLKDLQNGVKIAKAVLGSNQVAVAQPVHVVKTTAPGVQQPRRRRAVAKPKHTKKHHKITPSEDWMALTATLKRFGRPASLYELQRALNRGADSIREMVDAACKNNVTVVENIVPCNRGALKMKYEFDLKGPF